MVGAIVQLTTGIAFMPSAPILSRVLDPFGTCLGGFGNSAGRPRSAAPVAAPVAAVSSNLTET